MLIGVCVCISLQVKGLYSYQNELSVIRNLKRGVAGLLQLQLTSGKRQEVTGFIPS